MQQDPKRLPVPLKKYTITFYLQFNLLVVLVNQIFPENNPVFFQAAVEIYRA